VAATRALVLAATCAIASPAFAAHPMISEDTGTQGTGRFELELGFAGTHEGDTRSYEYGPQLSYGLVPTLDLIVRPVWLDVRQTTDTGSAHQTGIGDTALDFKWRFRSGDPVSLGVRAGVGLVTGDSARGLSVGSTTYHAVLIATANTAPFSFDANVGYATNPVDGERRGLWYISGAAVWSVNERLRFTFELADFTNPAQSDTAWQPVTRIGAIATVTPWLDVDVGYQMRLEHGSVSIALAGATLRW
jgi:hypothetical protein